MFLWSSEVGHGPPRQWCHGPAVGAGQLKVVSTQHGPRRRPGQDFLCVILSLSREKLAGGHRGQRSARPRRAMSRTARFSGVPFVLCSAARVHLRNARAARANSAAYRRKAGPDRCHRRGSLTLAVSAVRIQG
jgi:hypothetical protein